MGNKRLQAVEKKSDAAFFLPFPEPGFSWKLQEELYPSGGLFASVGQMGVGFGISPNSPNPTNNNDVKVPGTDLYVKYVTPEVGYRVLGTSAESTAEETNVEEEVVVKKKGKGAMKLKIKIGNPHFRRLFSGGIAGAVSRTAVAPLETIRTHLMVGSNGNSSGEVFQTIMKTEGWKGLFRGNFVNVIRVAPSKAIELFAYDTAKKVLTPKEGEQPKLPIPPSLISGAFAGVSSTICTYPLELLKTRLTIQRDVYDNLLHAFTKIVREEGPAELFRGLTPSLIGVIPYAATNYFAYDSLKKLYKKTFKTEEVGNIPILLIGSAAGAISSSATFPLEVARKHMQVGAVGGRQVYKNMLHALLCILEKEGIGGLYKGLGPSCMKLVPAAGISFMCYEACKKILIDEEES
ncbi:adenine nucleotide transporter BT1, chloroplastic/mitochondrial [Canna indica]|uniref:Adenine nucleotide transporter BT1, chloroplastic/mitochondrial n=1 Tax=Canna indica TaxID=4628 RepID=A0AAQ3KI03_9LILI|nr:adenine nucleotide transporter BT1, chloroplastic/mitochondrial [Canna indica]